MLKEAKSCEGIIHQFNAAKEQGDNVVMLKTGIALLKHVMQWHKKLEDIAQAIQSKCHWFMGLQPDFINVYSHGEILSKSWISIETDCIVRNGNELATLQKQYNEEMTLLRQFMIDFELIRNHIVDCMKPVNIGQRELQNILYATLDRPHWLGCLHNQRSMIGWISGKFVELTRKEDLLGELSRKSRQLNNKKGKKGRLSLSGGQTLCCNIVRELNRPTKAAYTHKGEQYKRWNKYYKDTLFERLVPFIRQSRYYTDRLSWVVGLKEYDRLGVHYVLQNYDRLKQYKGTNKLAFINAVNKSPSVTTICTDKLELIGHCQHLNHQIPVYRVDCQLLSDDDDTRYAYFMGKTGSDTLDSVTCTIDWWHSESAANDRALSVLTERLQYAFKFRPKTEQELRMEKAIYARKLVWLGEISMLDSKNAGNCLPGTIKFSKEIGLPVPNNWEDFRTDCRQLLRQWKKLNYAPNVLFYKAIDCAVNRLKSQVLSLTAHW